MPKAAGKDKEMDGVEKAAILLIALGPEKSAQIFKHLKEDEIEQLNEKGAHIVNLGKRILRTETSGFVATALLQ